VPDPVRLTEPTEMKNLDGLVRRIRRLERTLGVCAVVGATLGTLLVVNAVSPRSPEIVAKRLSIVDSHGKPAIVLSATEAGSFIWWFSEGTLRGAVTAGRDVTSLQLHTANGRESRVELRVDEANSPVLLMLDPHNVVRLRAGIDKAGEPSLKLFDEQHRPRAIWAMNNAGEAGLVLLNRGGNLVGGVAPR
jgi:hypothetical protein